MYASNGYPGQVLDFNYASIFAAGIEIGVFDLSGGNAPPNGLRWDATPAGLLALESFLAGAPAPSGPLVADALNPTSAPGAGSLAVQTAALQINIALNDAGVLGSALSGYSALVYSNHPGIPDSLDGQTVTQLLGIANQVLAGGSLPAGYSYDSLATLIENLNLSYHGCVETLFGSRFLFHPGRSEVRSPEARGAIFAPRLSPLGYLKFKPSGRERTEDLSFVSTGSSR